MALNSEVLPLLGLPINATLIVAAWRSPPRNPASSGAERFPATESCCCTSFGGDDDDHRGLAAPQRNLVIHNLLYLIGSRSGAFCKTSTRLPRTKPISMIRRRNPPCPQYVEDRGRLSGFQFRKTHFFFTNLRRAKLTEKSGFPIPRYRYSPTAAQGLPSAAQCLVQSLCN